MICLIAFHTYFEILILKGSSYFSHSHEEFGRYFGENVTNDYTIIKLKLA